MADLSSAARIQTLDPHEIEAQRTFLLECLSPAELHTVKDLEQKLGLGTTSPREILAIASTFLGENNLAPAYALADIVTKHESFCTFREKAEAHGIAMVSTMTGKSSKLSAVHFEALNSLLLTGSSRALENTTAQRAMGETGNSYDFELCDALNYGAKLFQSLANNSELEFGLRQILINQSSLLFAWEFTVSQFSRGGIPEDLRKLVRDGGFTEPYVMAR